MRDFMGCFADRQDLWEELEEVEYYDRLSRGVWVTKEGRHIPIKDMDSAHLLNAINLLEGEFPDSEYIKLMQDEISRRW